MLIQLSIVGAMIAGVLLIIGARLLAKRLLAVAVGLAILAPCLDPAACRLFAAQPSWLGALLVLALVILFTVAWLRYRSRRRHLRQLGDQKPTSQKRRVDRGL